MFIKAYSEQVKWECLDKASPDIQAICFDCTSALVQFCVKSHKLACFLLKSKTGFSKYTTIHLSSRLRQNEAHRSTRSEPVLQSSLKIQIAYFQQVKCFGKGTIYRTPFKILWSRLKKAREQSCSLLQGRKYSQTKRGYSLQNARQGLPL